MKTSITVTTEDRDAQINTVELSTSTPNETVRTERVIKVPAGETKTIELAGDAVDYRLRPAGEPTPAATPAAA